MTGPIGAERRALAVQRLRTEPFDLLVVGAGIIGSRVAYEAARRGLRVALVDAGDFGGATSSASSKLIHGGLRYLARYDYGLVREALSERHALLTRVAPHLVHRLTFLLPLYRRGPWHPVVIGGGLVLYSALSAFRDSEVRLVSPGRARRIVSVLNGDGLRAAGIFQDAQTDDARLCLATVKGAALAGAVVVNHARVTAIEPAGDGLRSASVAAGGGDDLAVRCRVVINAAGPWVDAVRRLDDPASAPLVRLSKGVHLTMPLDDALGTALIVPIDHSRVSFAIPWHGLLLLGTTDTPYDGDPAQVAASPEDVRTVLREAGLALPTSMLDPGRVLCTMVGLRALPLGKEGTAQAPREHVIAVSARGMISVAGGKLTTHRLIAIDALHRLPSALLGGAKAIRPDDAPLPGAGAAVLPPEVGSIDPTLLLHLQGIYGGAAGRVLEYAKQDGAALDRIHPGSPDIWAQAQYAIDQEWASTVDDITRRRTTLSVRGLAGEDVRARLSVLLKARGLSPS